MLIEPELLTPATRLVTGLVAGAGLVFACATAPWRAWLSNHERQWVWLGGAGCLIALWSMKAGISAITRAAAPSSSSRASSTRR